MLGIALFNLQQLDVPYGRIQNRQVGRFLLIRLERELLLQLLEALLQMSPSILFQLVVHFSCTNAAIAIRAGGPPPAAGRYVIQQGARTGQPVVCLAGSRLN